MRSAVVIFPFSRLLSGNSPDKSPDLICYRYSRKKVENPLLEQPISLGTINPNERTLMMHLHSFSHWTDVWEIPGLETPGPTHSSLNISKNSPPILVVEDDPSVAGLLNTVLEDWGYHVYVAGNGREGLDVVMNHRVDGILLDMHMPVMNGRTMLDELRWLGYQIPVLAMSGGLDLPALRQLLTEGAQGFFLKPFNLQSLKQSCRQIFEKEESSSPFLNHLRLT